MAGKVKSLARQNKSHTTLVALKELQRDFLPSPLRLISGMVHGPEIKYVTWEVPLTYSHIEILHVTDLQFGHILCNVAQIEKYMAWILAEKYRFIVFGGDLIDAATVLSPGQPWENLCEPQGQIYKLIALLAPIRHRVLGYVGGNHERRGIKTFGDLGTLIASLLQVPYSSGQQFVNIRYGEHKRFTIFLWHGRGSARTPGAKLMMLYYAMKELAGDAQVTLVGHLHDAILKWSTYRKHEGNKIVDKKTVGAMSSSFLQYFGSYAEVSGLSPSDIIMARTELTPDGRWSVTVR